MTKRKILFGALAVFTCYLFYLLYLFVISPKTNLQSIYLIPDDAVFVMESDRPVASWSKISESRAWQHLKNNTYFAELTENIQQVDTIFNSKRTLFEFFDDRSLFISIHTISKKDYGIFYVLDLKRIAKLKLLKTYLDTLLDEGYVLSKRNYHEHEILEVYDRSSKETMYLAFIKNQLIASFTHSLVEASIDQHQEPVLGRDHNFIEINQQVGYENLFRLYVNYSQFNSYYYQFTDTPTDWVDAMGNNFLFSGFSFDMDAQSTLTANGFTNIDYKNENYLEALQRSGKAKRTIPSIAPKSTALYLSYGFDSFSEFYQNFMTVQKANNSAEFRGYEAGIKKVEKFLNINVQDNFVSWVGDEIAILQIKSSLSNKENDLALVLKTNDVDQAKENLDVLLRQIRKKTPVKFKAVSYKGHEIHFLSIKGFFKMVLGSRFKEFDKPYFTIIGAYVVFSDSPNTIKTIINGYQDGSTLATDPDFLSFDRRLEKETSLHAYANTPLLYDTFYTMADKATKSSLRQNKDFIICFPQVGFQLTPEDDLFRSRLVVGYEDVAQVKKKYVAEKPEATVSKTGGANEITETVFNLPPIYPNDLTAKVFVSNYGNGNIRFKVDLKNGRKHGRYSAYHPNGKKKITGRFKEDQQVGTWRYFDEEGNQMLKKKF
ncbi:Hypothetical protein I595_1909 [Croceitalea dokdonensis DOKDO 023]|uniref:DUF3352 domain-containing protein n=1 Tax=Croceitalea dokdonensis DOKDO 023 TaxID=1300341 RepID=A0A0P7B276_9FLAO|nr:DUF3352 domain-containing protein [Croceitalea dokdonensis]KPM32259.1 Hypothetical protein I595_1909 [Croceitalea dokdonensis DOKDO 023]